MMAWAVLLLLPLALLLPFRLLSLASRLLAHKPNHHNNKNNTKRRRWMLPFVSIPLLLSATVLALSDLDSPASKDDGLVAEVENLKFKISRLESILDESTDTLYSKNLQLDENNKLLEEMEQRIQFLQNSLSKLKTSVGSSSDSETMVKALEEEVRLLWAESRKNNFNYHILESKAYEEENKVEEVTSEVRKMESIITEQWIQIRQLEQSLQMMKIMISSVHKKSTSKVHKKKLTMFTVLEFIKGVRHRYLLDEADSPDTFFLGNYNSKSCISQALGQLRRIWSVAKNWHHEFIKGVRHRYLLDEADLPDTFFLGNYISKSCISQALGQLRRIWSVAKNWHHELQDSVKQALEMNEFTAPLANQEVVFFLASAVVVVPAMSAWALLW